MEAYVVSRPDDDIADADEAVATLVLPALTALVRQHRVLDDAPGWRCDRAWAAGPTEREFAVLTLLGEGLTAQVIPHRLRPSPRTVQDHVEHLHRELGVRDRLVAVQRARDAGLRAPSPGFGGRRGARTPHR